MDYTILAHVAENDSPVSNEVEVYGDFREFLDALTAYGTYANFRITDIFEGEFEYIVVICYDLKGC